MERVAIFGLIDIDLESTGQSVVRLSTDLPATSTPAVGPLPAGWAVRETKAIAATGRRVVRLRLQGTTKGRLYIFTLSGITGVTRLYGAKIWARVLPSPSWDWYTVPVPPTSEEWTAVKLEIPPTSDWGPAKLPIAETGDWTPAKLAIAETGDWTPAKLSIPETSDWIPAKLPIAPTPQNPEWVNLEIDS